MKLEGKTIEQAAQTLTTLRRYAPYRFGGKWFLAIINGQAIALRDKRGLANQAAKAGLQTCPVIL